MPKVYVRKTEKTGKGLFATTVFRKGETIFRFRGQKITDLYDDRYMLGPRWLGIGNGIWLDVTPTNPGYYINHSCQPNAGFRGSLTVVAMKPIKKDEEITIDYSITEEDPYWKMPCRCGKKDCRKTIRGIQSLHKNTFRKYRPYISVYMKRVYLSKER